MDYCFFYWALDEEDPVSEENLIFHFIYKYSADGELIDSNDEYRYLTDEFVKGGVDTLRYSRKTDEHECECGF